MRKNIYWFLLICGLRAGAPAQAQSAPDTLRHADWKIYWANEFNTPGDSSVLADRWDFAYPWGRNLGGYEDQYYTGRQVSVDSAGLLHLRARLLPQPHPYRGRPLRYASGMLFNRFKQAEMQVPGCPSDRTGFTHGLFEMRCRLPRTTSTSSAFWLFGQPDEVDIFEAGTPGLIGNNIILWSHDYWRPGPQGQANESSQSFFFWPGPGSVTDDFHTFALRWEPGELVFYFDGIPIRRETNFLPLGCPMDVIANFAMMAWARDRADSYDIDYIRVYQLRQPVARPPVWPVVPVVGLGRFPRVTALVASAVQPQMDWFVEEAPARRPRLVLRHNLNPPPLHSLALPVRGRWVSPLVAFNDGYSPRHRIASPDGGHSALSWTLYDLCGRPVRSGQQGPAASWDLSWPEVEPGAYSLRLRMGPRQVRQTVYQLGRPDDVVFTPEWLAPLPAELAGQ